MDERLLLFVWLVGGGGYFGLLGAGFGALAGHLSYRQGRVVGTGVGLGVARNVERVSRRTFSMGRRGALVGAVDGFLFFACVGIVFGLIGSHYHLGIAEAALIALGALLLICAALFFGGMGHLARQGGLAAVAAFFLGAIALGTLGYLWSGTEGLLMGILGGACGGMLVRHGTRTAVVDPRQDHYSDQSET